MADTKTTWSNASDPRDEATREFVIERSECRPVTGAVWLPRNGTSGQPMIVLGHGASGDRYQIPIPHLASRFSTAGYPVLSMDGPVHGLRQVGPGGREALMPEMMRPTAIDDMVEDWQLAISTTQALEAVGQSPLAYFGLSMGSIFGIPLIASRSDVVVAVLGLLGTRGPTEGLAERLLGDAAQIHCPLLYLMQLEDELFERSGYFEVFDALPAEDKRLHANPGLHPEIPQEEIDWSFEFLRSHLEGAAQRRIVNPLAE